MTQEKIKIILGLLRTFNLLSKDFPQRKFLAQMISLANFITFKGEYNFFLIKGGKNATIGEIWMKGTWALFVHRAFFKCPMNLQLFQNKTMIKKGGKSRINSNLAKTFSHHRRGGSASQLMRLP